MSERITRVAFNIKKHVADYINKVSNRRSLITVTDVRISRDLSRATILVSVFPDSHADAAIDFLKRKRAELRTHIKKQLSMKTIPHFDVELDRGEKHRQHIDTILEE